MAGMCATGALLVTHPLYLTVAAAVKELQSNVIQFMASFVRHFTLSMVAQQAGPFMLGDKCTKLHGTDPYVLIGQCTVLCMASLGNPSVCSSL